MFTDKWKGVFIGLLLGSMLSGGIVVASSQQATIQVFFKKMNFRIDGQEKQMTNGSPIIYKGTTYVPLRFVGESLDRPVTYDSQSNTIWVGKQVVVATYKGGIVTRQELDKQIAVLNLFNQFDEQTINDPALQTNVLHQLLAHRWNQNKLEVAKMAEVKQVAIEELGKVKSYFTAEVSKDEFDKRLKSLNLLESDVYQYIEHSIMMRKLFEPKVTDKETRDVYELDLFEDKDRYTFASVRHILIAAEGRTEEEVAKRVKEVQDKLAAGGDFATLAKEYSDDPGSKDSGGLYADQPVSQYVPEFKDAAVKQELNKVGAPVKTTYGTHLMIVEKRETKSYEQLKPDLLRRAVADKVNEYISGEVPKLITDSNVSLK